MTAMLLQCVFSDGVVSAVEAKWGGALVHKLYEAPSRPLPNRGSSCPTTIVPVRVLPDGKLTDACVYGSTSTTRLARYIGASGEYSYAVAFRTDRMFVPIKDFCQGRAHCVYSSTYDSLLLQDLVVAEHTGHALVKNFSSYLKLYGTGLDRHYKFEHSGMYTYLGNEIQQFVTGAVGLSNNGEWAVIEMNGFGFVAVNMNTFAARRVVAYAQSPFNTLYELAITNDGRTIAVTGFRAKIEVYELDGSCGDGLEYQVHYTQELSQLCPQAQLDLYGIFPFFFYAQMPRFSDDGMSLSLKVYMDGGPRLALLSPKPSVGAGSFKYIAFGDSFTSGEGELRDAYYEPTTNIASNKCHVSVRSYPYLVGRAWDMLTKNSACSGSRTEGVLSATSTVANESPPAVISLGVGGNDVDFVGKLKSCLSPGTCAWSKPSHRIATALEIQRFFSRYIEVLEVMKRNFPNTQLLAIGYPKIIADAPDALCDPITGTLLTHDERIYMDYSIAYLNTVIEAAALYANVQFIDVQDAFRGNRLCEGASLAMNSVRLGDDIAPISSLPRLNIFGAESFHPTPFGHKEVAESILARYQSPDNGHSCEACVYQELELAPLTYWTEAGLSDSAVPSQFAQDFISVPDDGAISAGARAAIYFPPRSFKPGSSVTLKPDLESSGEEMYEVAPDGSIEGSYVVSTDNDGHGTVVVEGESSSGDPVIVYQSIRVKSDSEQPDGVGTIASRSVESTVYPGHKAVTADAGLHIESKKSGIVQASKVLAAHDQPTLKTPSRKQNAQAPLPIIGYLVSCLAAAIAIVVFIWFACRKRKRRS